MNVAAIILARGGSKGIPLKNVIDFCGKPLIAWTIQQLQQAKGINSIWVSSDNEEILSIGRNYGVESILRPTEISGDLAIAESGLFHALELIEKQIRNIDLVLAPQVTSPLRESSDIERGLNDFQEQHIDSMFSCSVVKDLFFWEKTLSGDLMSVSYDYKNRQRRQDIPDKFVENGSFYLSKPDVLRKYNNRLGGRIGMTIMDLWKMFEIDSIEDLRICESLMKTFLLGPTKKKR